MPKVLSIISENEETELDKSNKGNQINSSIKKNCISKQATGQAGKISQFFFASNDDSIKEIDDSPNFQNHRALVKTQQSFKTLSRTNSSKLISLHSANRSSVGEYFSEKKNLTSRSPMSNPNSKRINTEP